MPSQHAESERGYSGAMGFMGINSHWRTKLRRDLPLRFFVVLVAGIPVRNLLLRAKHLFVAAIDGWGSRGLAPNRQITT
jgi:hypothetical protein